MSTQIIISLKSINTGHNFDIENWNSKMGPIHLINNLNNLKITFWHYIQYTVELTSYSKCLTKENLFKFQFHGYFWAHKFSQLGFILVLELPLHSAFKKNPILWWLFFYK